MEVKYKVINAPKIPYKTKPKWRAPIQKDESKIKNQNFWLLSSKIFKDEKNNKLTKSSWYTSLNVTLVNRIDDGINAYRINARFLYFCWTPMSLIDWFRINAEASQAKQDRILPKKIEFKVVIK